jgi:hypothetical protein
MAGPGHLPQVYLPVADAPVSDHQIVESGDRRHLLEPGASTCSQLITGKIKSNQTGPGHR